MLGSILFVIRNGPRWRDAPTAYWSAKTICNRFIRWSRRGVFNRSFADLSAGGEASDFLRIDASHIKAHCTAASLLKKGLYPDGPAAASAG